MKYRIKVVEWENSTEFIPQRKTLFFWRNYYPNNMLMFGSAKKVFYKEKDAIEYIKTHKQWPVINHIYLKGKA